MITAGGPVGFGGAPTMPPGGGYPNPVGMGGMPQQQMGGGMPQVMPQQMAGMGYQQSPFQM